MTEWRFNGVSGRGPMPPLANAFVGKRALVLGTGRTLFADMEAATGQSAGAPPGDWDIICCNYAGLLLPYAFQHWASVHGDWLTMAHALRLYTYRTDPHIWTHSSEAGAENRWQFEYEGQTGPFAAQLARALGYAPIVLCGVPEDQGGYFYSPPNNDPRPKNFGAEDVWRQIAEAADQIYSMSGMTRRLFGAPPWVNASRGEAVIAKVAALEAGLSPGGGP